MSAVDTIQHTAAHGAAGVVDAVKRGVAWFAEWRRTARARAQAYDNLRYMTARDFADLGVSRSQMEYHLRTSRRFDL